MSIIQAMQHHRADRIAVRIGALDISYGRLLADVAAVAARLADKGVGIGAKLGLVAGALHTGHGYANWVAHLASIQLGAAHVSIADPSSLAAALQSGMIDTIVGPAAALVDVPASVGRIMVECDPRQPTTPAAALADRSSAAIRLNLTSGTTGSPKVVAWDGTMIEDRVAQVADGLSIDHTTLLYCLLHIRTTAGFRFPLAVWQVGGCVLLPDNPEVRVRDRALGQSTLIAASPVQLAERVRQFTTPWEGRDQRTIIVLGGRLPSAIRDAALANACENLLIGYGSTETGSVALGDSTIIDRHSGAVGTIRDGVTVEIVDAARVPVAAGEAGLVRIKADLMSAGYEAVAPGGESGHFDGGYFYPGDVGRLLPGGLLAIEGRINDTFNVGGWKVNAAELEASLAGLPGVVDLCACVMPLAEGDLLTLAVVTRDDVDLQSVAGLVQAKLPKGRTFHLVRLQSIPRNAMGKVPRAVIANQLTMLYADSRKTGANA